MDNSNEVLKRFYTQKSKYLVLREGEEVKLRFLWAEETPNNYDGGATTLIRYHVEVNGKEQLFERSSRSLAQQMANIPEGKLIFIKRMGEKGKTRYLVRMAE